MRVMGYRIRKLRSHPGHWGFGFFLSGPGLSVQLGPWIIDIWKPI